MFKKNIMKNNKFTPAGLKVSKPFRYVYHVSSPKNRMSILFEGIRPFPSKDNKQSLVFVNNLPIHISVDEFWPLPIDIYDCKKNYGEWTNKVFYSLYDFWRIDTTKFNTTWYVDPYLEKDLYSYNLRGKPHNYLCTSEIIPPHTLDLMEYDMEGFNRFHQTKIKSHPELIYSDFNTMVQYQRDRNVGLLESIRG